MATRRYLNRPSKSHPVGDAAARQISDVCLERGWAVQEIHRDYGEDLLVQPVDDHNDDSIEHFRLWIQSKGAKDLSKHILKSGDYSYAVSFAHAYKWLRSADLCIVVLWDTTKRHGVYAIPSESLDEEHLYIRQPASITLRFPSENRFDAGELERVAWRARVHHFKGLISAASVERTDAEDPPGLLWARILDFLVALRMFRIDPDDGLRVDESFLDLTKRAFVGLGTESQEVDPVLQLRQAMMLALVIHFESITGIKGFPRFLADSCEAFLLVAIPLLRAKGELRP